MNQQQILYACGVIIAVSVLIIIGIALISKEEPTVADNAARMNLYLSCAVVVDDDGNITSNKRDGATCEAWADETLRAKLSAIRECQQSYQAGFGQYNERVLLERFEQCVTQRGIQYPSIE